MKCKYEQRRKDYLDIEYLDDWWEGEKKLSSEALLMLTRLM